MRWIVLTTESSVVTVPRRLRLRERDLYPFKCDLPPCERRTFPVADILKRLVAHFFVLSLGIFVSLMCSPLAGRAVDESPGRPENGQKYIYMSLSPEETDLLADFRSLEERGKRRVKEFIGDMTLLYGSEK